MVFTVDAVVSLQRVMIAFCFYFLNIYSLLIYTSRNTGIYTYRLDNRIVRYRRVITSLSSDNSNFLGKMTTNIVFQIVKRHPFFCWARVSLKQVSDPRLMHVYLYSYICVFYECKAGGKHVHTCAYQPTV